MSIGLPETSGHDLPETIAQANVFPGFVYNKCTHFVQQASKGSLSRPHLPGTVYLFDCKMLIHDMELINICSITKHSRLFLNIDIVEGSVG